MWKNYFVLSGRSTRRDFWVAYLVNIVVAALVGYVSGLLNIALLGGLYSLLMIIPMWTLEVRRLHDISKSGWWLLISLIPAIGFIILIIFLATASVDEGNVYGDIVFNNIGTAIRNGKIETVPSVTRSDFFLLKTISYLRKNLLIELHN